MSTEDPTPWNDGGKTPTPSVLVTGSAGFIGSHLCDRLLDDGCQVWGLDNFDSFYEPARKRDNLASTLRRPTMHLVEGDVQDEILLDGLMSDVNFDAVVHLAALPGVWASLENPELCYDVNVMGTLRVLEAMQRHDVSVFLFGSSSSVYGEDSSPPFTEDMTAARPVSAYAASKRSVEMLSHTHHRLHGLTAYCLRLATVYGPRERPDLAVQSLARRLIAGEKVPVRGDGSSRLDVAYVDDIVEGLVLSLERALETSGTAPDYEILNLGGGRTVQLDELLDVLSDVLGLTPRMEQLPEQPGDASVSHASIEKSGRLLDWRPTTTLREGLTSLVEWLDRHEPRVGASPPASPVRSLAT